MSNRKMDSHGVPRDQPLRERDEIGAAMRDVTYRLTHDLADTREDLRDAAAFAPLAAVKVIERCATALTARPKRTIAVIAGFAIVAASMAAICRKKA